MSQYTNIVKNTDGSTTTAVYNTESNTIAYTITSASGKVVSLTLPASDNPLSVQNRGEWQQQLRNQGESVLTVGAGLSALNTVKTNTTSQAQRADTASTATNTPVPANPSPPPPVSSNTDPEVQPPTPAPATVTPTNSTPAPVTPTAGTQSTATEPTPVEITVPPGTDTEEEGTQPGLAEPPNVDEPINGLDLPPTVGVELTVPPGTDTEEEGTQPGLAEPPNVDEPINGLDLGPGSGAEGGGDELGGGGGPRGTTAAELNTRTNATQQDEANFKQFEDWRVRLSLAPNSKYLYNVEGAQGILAPLAATNGILFPYTPAISVSYAASYEPFDVAHSNYKIYQYKNSSVDNIQITCNFTAQDTFEANYLLSVIHFLRTVTKMFYGRDQNPSLGSPPPLCFLTGLGSFQFDSHPLAITNFSYNLPDDVDYIRAGTTTTNAGVNKSPERSPNNSGIQNGQRNTGVGSGATVPPPKFTNVPGGTIEPTYVPTKIQIQISAIPIVTRNNISNNFSVKEYATGKLLQGSKTKLGGIW